MAIAAPTSLISPCSFHNVDYLCRQTVFQCYFCLHSPLSLLGGGNTECFFYCRKLTILLGEKGGGFGLLPLQGASGPCSPCTEHAPRAAQGAQQSTWPPPGHWQPRRCGAQCPSPRSPAWSESPCRPGIEQWSIREEPLAPLGPRHGGARLLHHPVLRECRGARGTLHAARLPGKAGESRLPLELQLASP